MVLSFHSQLTPGSRQLALSVDNHLYYTLSDPTGISLLLTDSTASQAGRILYDAYGGVLTSTIPATLTGVLAGAPDPDTNLVHLGGGRYYDPSMGRPLQPNPAGGPPTVPQALNRYAATPLGQPGVAEGAGSGGGFNIPAFVPGILLGRSYGYAFGLLGEAGAFRTGVFGATYHLFLKKTSLEYRRTNGQLATWLDDLGEGWQEVGSNFYRTGADNAHALDAATLLYFMRKNDPSLEFELIAQKIPSSGRFNPLDDLGWVNKAAKLDLAASLFVAVGTELAFGTYWRDPYLQSWQKGGQFGVALFGTGVSWGVVVGTGALLGGPLGLWATLLVGGTTDLIWNIVVAPQINSWRGFDQRIRNLQPLKQN